MGLSVCPHWQPFLFKTQAFYHLLKIFKKVLYNCVILAYNTFVNFEKDEHIMKTTKIIKSSSSTMVYAKTETSAYVSADFDFSTGQETKVIQLDISTSEWRDGMKVGTIMSVKEAQKLVSDLEKMIDWANS